MGVEPKGITGQDNVYSAIAYGKISVPVMFSKMLPDHQDQSDQEEEGILKKIFKKVSLQTKDLVLIDGLEDILITFAKCCLPISGDPIVGFVTRGRGVTVHRIECPRVPAIDPERRVNAAWNQKLDFVRIAKLRITSENKPGMLASIAQSISDKKINIAKAMISTTHDEKAIISLQISVKNLKELSSAMKAIEKISGVIGVEREMG